MTWIVYADGGCKQNPGPAGWGAVIISPDGTEEEANGFIGKGTNQIAELTAAIEGLRKTPEKASVELVSDSQYVLKGLTEWRHGWARKGWRNSKNEVIANFELWMALFIVADARYVTTRWVKGHSGDKYNERCDVLAGQSILGS
jgi:ribonuclease HI